MIVKIRKSAIKESKPYKTKIKLAIKNLENFPNLSNIKKLTNHIPAYRLRVGAKMKLDEFEKEILESIENNEWISKGNIDKRKKELKSYIEKSNFTQSK